jgi:hypothetical protein
MEPTNSIKPTTTAQHFLRKSDFLREAVPTRGGELTIKLCELTPAEIAIVEST